MLIFAHGGYSAKFPENTIESYVAALQHNPNYLEMDVSVLNGRIFFYHPNRLFGDGLHMVGENTPPKDVAFEYVMNKIIMHRQNTKFFFDIKSPEITDIVKIVNEAQSYVGPSDILIGTRNIGITTKLKYKLSCEFMALSSQTDDYLEYKKLGIKKYRVFEKYVTEGLVKDIHQEGMEVIVTMGEKGSDKASRKSGVATRESYLKIEKMGVDGVIINDLSIVH